MTLVEVLVAIAILLVLAGLVSTFVGPSLRRAKTASCVSNVRQVAMALIQYGADSDGRYPPYLSLASTPSNRAIFFCPSDPYKEKGGHWTYWMNYIQQSPRSESSYGYTFDAFGQLQYEATKDEYTKLEEFPVLLVCLTHQPDPSPLGLANGLDGPVVRGLRDGSVEIKRMKTNGVSSEELFGR